MKKNILVFFGFCALTAAMTYPLIFKINNHMPGFFSTDEPSLWYYWWLRYSHAHGITSVFSNFIAFPFGIDLSVVEKINPLWSGITKSLALIGNECFIYNIQALSGFILAGFFIYLMVKRLTASRVAAFFSGIIFAFCPYHFVRSWQHLGLAYTQWLPLFLFSLFLLKDKINKKNIIFAFLSFYLVFSFDLYYAYFSLLIVSVFVIYLLLKERKGSSRPVFWITVVSLANILVLAFRLMPIIAAAKVNISPSEWGIVRPFDYLFSQSARPLSYFLPASVHPIFGRFTEQFVGTSLYGGSFTEHVLYLGWTPLALAFIAFKKRRGNFYIGFFLLLTVAAWIFSQPPWWSIFGFKIYMPSFFMYKIIPMFRAYCRFGIVLMLAVAVLAGFGLKFILGKFKSQKTKIAVTVLFSALVLFEFWNYPPFKVIDLSRVPQVYYWLKEQPGDFVIAEYPLDAKNPNEKYKFAQTVHEKRIINGTIPGTYAHDVAQTIIKLSDLNTAKALYQMKVKYILVHREGYFKTDLVEDREELERIPLNSDLKLIKRFPAEECLPKGAMCMQKTGPIDVYELRIKSQ